MPVSSRVGGVRLVLSGPTCEAHYESRSVDIVRRIFTGRCLGCSARGPPEKELAETASSLIGTVAIVIRMDGRGGTGVAEPLVGPSP
jgi:hypothetical protein